MLQGYKTYIGILVVMIAFIGEKLGYIINADGLTEFLHASINDIAVISGAVTAWYGRAKAYKTFINKK